MNGCFSILALITAVAVFAVVLRGHERLKNVLRRMDELESDVDTIRATNFLGGKERQAAPPQEEPVVSQPVEPDPPQGGGGCRGGRGACTEHARDGACRGNISACFCSFNSQTGEMVYQRSRKESGSTTAGLDRGGGVDSGGGFPGQGVVRTGLARAAAPRRLRDHFRRRSFGRRGVVAQAGLPDFPRTLRRGNRRAVRLLFMPG